MTNEIQKISFVLGLHRALIKPVWFVRWFLKRVKLVWQFVRVSHNAQQIEWKYRYFCQIRNDHQYAGRMDEYFETKGFCDGIEYCLKEKWRQ